ncbi:MAG: hypothetical protein WCF90_07425 [Methanomicrobiales archaeon]
MLPHIRFPVVVLWAVVVLQTAIVYAAPLTLFVKWKDDCYKEKLEWDAFTHPHSDKAMIQKDAPADFSIWGEWLVYSTALGVGDKVERAMKTLDISIPETGVPLWVMGMNSSFLPLIHFTPPSHSSYGGAECR